MRTAHLLSTTRPLEISFSRACNIPYVMLCLQFIVLLPLETLQGCASAWLRNCLLTETNICLVEIFFEGTRTVDRKFSMGVLCVCSGGLDIQNFDKISTDLYCFKIQFGGIGALFRAKARNPPVTTGLERTQVNRIFLLLSHTTQRQKQTKRVKDISGNQLLDPEHLSRFPSLFYIYYYRIPRNVKNRLWCQPFHRTRQTIKPFHCKLSTVSLHSTLILCLESTNRLMN